MAPTAEDRLTAWLRRIAPGGGAIGDDVAALGALGDAVATVDQQIAGTHFPDGLDPALIARRLLEVNLSDIAAAGAQPEYALLALAAPPTFAHRRLLRRSGRRLPAPSGTTGRRRHGPQRTSQPVTHRSRTPTVGWPTARSSRGAARRPTVDRRHRRRVRPRSSTDRARRPNRRPPNRAAKEVPPSRRVFEGRRRVPFGATSSRAPRSNWDSGSGSALVPPPSTSRTAWRST